MAMLWCSLRSNFYERMHSNNAAISRSIHLLLAHRDRCQQLTTHRLTGKFCTIRPTGGSRLGAPSSFCTCSQQPDTVARYSSSALCDPTNGRIAASCALTRFVVITNSPTSFPATPVRSVPPKKSGFPVQNPKKQYPSYTL